MILIQNNRIPKYDIQLHLLKIYFPEELRALYKIIRDSLHKKGFEAVVTIECTCDDKCIPNNCVHYHFLTDDIRSIDELIALFITACEKAGLTQKEDFTIKLIQLFNGLGYFYYFTKCGKHKDKVILFQNGLNIQKFHFIGNWFRKTQEKLWKEFIAARD
jgi:hypothetical protein